ncbi:MAG: hypothetical protein SGI74_11055 [Oligoflexia bacterium]|nr:hypothetical protein [Oligoflexia bacterium]
MRFKSILVIILLTLALPFQASAGLGEICNSLFQTIIGRVPSLEKIQLTQVMRDELTHAYQVLLKAQTKPTSKSETSHLDIPSTIQLNETQYNILGYLGYGGEGEVFLVESGGIKYSIKVFHEKSLLTGSIKDHKKIKRNGFNSVEPLEIDTKRNSVLFRYVEGPDLHLIFKNYGVIFNLRQELKISETTRSYIKQHFDVLKVLYDSKSGLLLFTQNVIFDLNSD